MVLRLECAGGEGRLEHAGDSSCADLARHVESWYLDSAQILTVSVYAAQFVVAEQAFSQD